MSCVYACTQEPPVDAQTARKKERNKIFLERDQCSWPAARGRRAEGEEEKKIKIKIRPVALVSYACDSSSLVLLFIPREREWERER